MCDIILNELPENTIEELQKIFDANLAHLSEDKRAELLEWLLSRSYAHTAYTRYVDGQFASVGVICGAEKSNELKFYVSVHGHKWMEEMDSVGFDENDTSLRKL